ncbi:little elongation complex subunit 2-like, partial [Ascaphus truei]|uniref:little elongation complex subunit 2-like n=1 Tax=Ascaphus truei TaxID=8439 RepID=UPI003F5A168D
MAPPSPRSARDMAPPSPRSARGKPAEARMEGGGKLCWNIEPYNGKNCFFTRESYEKYSLGPTLTELWQLSARTTVAPVETPSAPQTGGKASPPLPASKVPEVIPATRDALPHPAPRVPYPYFSSLSEMEQITYVNLMIKYLNKKRNFKPSATDLKEYEQYLSLKSKASNESKEFHKFLQNGARSCAEDYNWLSTDAQLYTEEVLKACRTYVTNYPEHYTVHEITSITGGKFITDLTLKLEKSLLKLGTVQFARIAFPTSALLLPADFQMVAELMPPASKAAILHTAVSSDPNAAKLATKYRPQVVLTAQALYALLNNHAGGYKEQWEIPVRVQTVCAAGSDPTKVIYLDSPLPRKQQSVREKNQMFHEVPLDLFMAKKSGVPLNIIRLGSAEAEQ